MNSLSVCVVVYNEEKLIRRCLESVKDLSGDIIVIHDGECSDRTLEIARQYTDKVFIGKRSGCMETHLPLAFAKAEGEWILRLDADEFLSSGLKKALPGLISSQEASGYAFLWPYWAPGRQLTRKWPYKRCLFRKSKMSYLAITHFLIEVEGRLEKSDLVLEHRPDYDSFAWATLKGKWWRWARVQAEACLKDFSEIGKFNYRGQDWPLAIRLRRKFPLLLIPAELLATFGKNFFGGAWRSGLTGFRIAAVLGIYRVMVNYWLWKLKRL